jgi:hypothetical protein
VALGASCKLEASARRSPSALCHTKSVRLVAAFTIFACLGVAQDLRQIVRRAVELDAQNVQMGRGYTFQERREQHELDGSGKVRRDEIRTWNVIPLEGTSYRRLVARNDVPLSAEEQRNEDEKLRLNTDQRRKETPQERQRRISDWERRQQQRTHEPIRELPDAFNFTPAGEAIIDGRTVYVIDARPRPGYRPKSQAAAFFPKIKARLWIDKAEGQWVKVEAETLETISIAGFVLRVAKGTCYTAEQMHVADNVWAPKRIWYKASARIALVKTVQLEVETKLSDYRRFPADAAAVTAVDASPR